MSLTDEQTKVESVEETGKSQDSVWKILKRTSLFQLALFAIGFLNELRLTGTMTSPFVSAVEGFGVVWTDDLVLSAIFGVALLVTFKWFPRVAGWLRRTITSFLYWAALGVAGFAVSMALVTLFW